MTPTQVISTLLKVNRPVAVFLLTGLGAFAAAAIVVGWNIDTKAAAISIAYIFAFAVFLYIVVFVFADRVLKLIIGYFSTFIFIAWTGAIFMSAVFPKTIDLPPPICLIQFLLDDCRKKDEVADRSNNTQVTTIAPTLSPSMKPPSGGSYHVSFYFAGMIDRSDVRAVMARLQQQGWKVNEVDKGGQRTPQAAGYNEIRYWGGDEAAKKDAEQLARYIQTQNLVSKPISLVAKPRSWSSANELDLEVWVSR